MEWWARTEGCALTLDQGDLTRAGVDAVVNAANSGLLGGGGVDGAIHRAAGPELLEACRALPAPNGVRCPPGEARLTGAFRLAARVVIHAVGPVYGASPDPHGTLLRAHRSCLALAQEHGCTSVAFPALACGIYGFPAREAAPIAMEAAASAAETFQELRFVLFSPEMYAVFREAAVDRFGQPLGLPVPPRIR